MINPYKNRKWSNNPPSKKVLYNLLSKYTRKQISQRYRVSISTVRRWIKFYEFPDARHDPTRHKFHKEHSPEDVRLIRALRKERLKYWQIAKKFDTSIECVHRICSGKSYKHIQ